VAPPPVQNDQAIFDYYASVAGAVDIPIAIHDFPESFRTLLSAELIARMGNDIEGLRYIKLEDYPVLAKMSRIQASAPDSIGIFGGLGGMYFLEELQRGSRGIMTGFAWPEVLVGVYEAFRSGDHARAAAIFDRYMPLIRYEFQPRIGLAYRKHVYHERGIIDTTFIRPPGMQIDGGRRAGRVHVGAEGRAGVGGLRDCPVVGSDDPKRSAPMTSSLFALPPDPPACRASSQPRSGSSRSERDHRAALKTRTESPRISRTSTRPP